MLKGDLPYDAFITEVLDSFEMLQKWNSDDIRIFVDKFIEANPEYAGKINELKLGLNAIWALGKRDLKQIIDESNAEYEAKRKARLERKRELRERASRERWMQADKSAREVTN